MLISNELNTGSEAPEVLHESEGLKIVKNPKNGFAIATLHFRAERAKRNPIWEAEARAGMVPARFEQEYNIQYDALFGQKVFPQIHDYPEKIIVHEYPDIPLSATCWAGLDWGMRNPTSFHVYTVVKNTDDAREDAIHCIWEHYEPTDNIEDLVARLKACPYWPQIRWIAFDPSLQSKNQAGIVPTSIYDQLKKAGMSKLRPGDREFEAPFISLMAQFWRELDTREPTFKIWSRCPNLIQELKDMIFITMSEKMLRTKDYKEKMRDKNNHAIDDLKYFLSRGPRINKAHAPVDYNKPGNVWMRHMR